VLVVLVEEVEAVAPWIEKQEGKKFSVERKVEVWIGMLRIVREMVALQMA